MKKLVGTLLIAFLAACAPQGHHKGMDQCHCRQCDCKQECCKDCHGGQCKCDQGQCCGGKHHGQHVKGDAHEKEQCHQQ